MCGHFKGSFEAKKIVDRLDFLSAKISLEYDWRTVTTARGVAITPRRRTTTSPEQLDSHGRRFLLGGEEMLNWSTSWNPTKNCTRTQMIPPWKCPPDKKHNFYLAWSVTKPSFSVAMQRLILAVLAVTAFCSYFQCPLHTGPIEIFLSSPPLSEAFWLHLTWILGHWYHQKMRRIHFRPPLLMSLRKNEKKIKSILPKMFSVCHRLVLGN